MNSPPMSSKYAGAIAAPGPRFTLRSLFFLMALVGVIVLPVSYWGFQGFFLSLLLGLFCVGAFVSVRLAIGLTMICILLGILIVPAINSPRINSRRDACASNLRCLALALDMYREANGHYPPSYVADAEGKPMHSWRVLILPYIEEQALYDAYDFSQPWDSPGNLAVAAQMPSIFRCPSDAASWNSPTTSYVAVVGPDTMWPPEEKRTGKDVGDKGADTLLLLDLPGSRMLWTEPADPTFESLIETSQSTGRPILAGNHARQCAGVFADGHVEFLPDDLGRRTLRSLLSIQGDKRIATPK